MKEREYLEGLYDTYKNLLTDREREYFENYFYEDYNLQEIADNYEVSKSYVGKYVNGIESKLKKFEEALGVFDKFNKIKAITKYMDDVATRIKIEEIIEKSKQEVKDITKKAGEEALFKLNLPRMNKDLVEMIGRLKFRTSYGQNALTHSIEVAHLSGIMASELGIDQQLAKRAGLLHDLGKALDFEMEGSHVELGVRFAKKYNENEVVINAIESHHGDVPAKFVISHLVSAADTLSAARPGARSETLDTYIKRIEQLESISKGFDGVSSAYAIQAGREVRVMVVPEKVDDVLAYKIARDIKNKIEAELTYPGQIKVTVVRETRASEIAK